MEAVLRQGLTMLTWSSVTLESFFQEADQVLYIYKQFLKKVYIWSLYKWNDNSEKLFPVHCSSYWKFVCIFVPLEIHRNFVCFLKYILFLKSDILNDFFPLLPWNVWSLLLFLQYDISPLLVFRFCDYSSGFQSQPMLLFECLSTSAVAHKIPPFKHCAVENFLALTVFTAGMPINQWRGAWFSLTVLCMLTESVLFSSLTVCHIISEFFWPH